MGIMSRSPHDWASWEKLENEEAVWLQKYYLFSLKKIHQILTGNYLEYIL